MGIDSAGRLINEPPPLLVHEDAIGKDEDGRFGDARARVDRLGVIAAEVAAWGSADLERHSDALALVEIAAAGNRAEKEGLRPDVLGKHLRIALVSSATEDDRA